MFAFTSTAPSTTIEERRATAMALRPLLFSRRLSRLVRAIGFLAVTRPTAIATVELLVDSLARARPMKAEPRERRTLRIHSA